MLPAEAAGETSARARVLLVDDHALLRTGVANIINQETDLHVVAEAGNGVEAIAAYERYHPDVTLLDLRMPVMEGVEVVRRIRERDPVARVIILTTYDTDDEISRALKAGAKAYSAKGHGGPWALRLERCSSGLIRRAPSDHSLVSVCTNASTSNAVSSHPCPTRAASVRSGRRVKSSRNSSSVMRRPTTRSTVRCDIGSPVRHCSRRSCARDVPACVQPGRPHF